MARRLRKQIAIALSQFPAGRDAGDIAEELGVDRKAVHSALWLMRSHGLVATDNGVSRLTDTGGEFARALIAGTPPAPVAAAAPPIRRAEAAHQVADGVIDNARRTFAVLRAYLDESIEITPLAAAHLADCEGAIDLIARCYLAAR